MSFFLLSLLFLFNNIFFKSYEYFFLEISDVSFILISLTILILILRRINSTLAAKTSTLFLKILAAISQILILLFIFDSIFRFYCLFEASLIPIFLLIIGWGYQPERLTASIWILIYTLSASIPLLGLILFFQEFFSIINFSILEKNATYSLPQKKKTIFFFKNKGSSFGVFSKISYIFFSHLTSSSPCWSTS